MKNITIITDSTWDRSNKDAERLGVKVVPLNVHFDDEQFLDGVTIDQKMFLKKLTSSNSLPTTSQPSPIEFEKVFREELKKGNKVLYIGIDGIISGTFNSATIAKNTIESDDIYLIDSKTATAGLSILVQIAYDLVQKEDDIEIIVSKINKIKDKIKLYAYVDTLKYLQKGGRLSSAQAFIGGVLNLKPIIMLKDSVILSYDKARGKKAALRKMVEAAKKDGVNTEYPIAFASIDSEDSIDFLVKEFNDAFDMKEYWIQELGSVVATHSGPGAAGFAFVMK